MAENETERTPTTEEYLSDVVRGLELILLELQGLRRDLKERDFASRSQPTRSRDW